MKYAKLIDGKPVVAPNPIKIDGCWWSNPPAEILRAEGYKPVIYADPPEPEPGYITVPGWEETEEEIVQMWTEEEEPDEVDGDRAMQILFEEGDGDA